jgi:hypothetical protein
VLDGLEGAASGGLDRAATDQTLSALGKRVFLLHDVHAGAPLTFKTRWALSYLRGPLSRDQIKALTSASRSQLPAFAKATAGKPASGAPLPAAGSPLPASRSTSPEPRSSSTQSPVLAPEIQQYFVPASDPDPHYTPVALGVARVTFADARLKINETRDVVAVAPIGDGAVPVDWHDAEVLEIAPADLETRPASGATFDAVPKPAASAKSYPKWQKAFTSWLAGAQTLQLYRHAGLKLTSKGDETERDFRIRVQTAQREARDAAVEEVRRKFAEKRARLEEKLRRAEQGVSREQEQASQAKLQTGVSMAATVFGALLGRKTLSTSTLGRATTAARGMGRASKEQDDVKRAQENVEVAKRGIEELDAAIGEETAGIAARFDADASAIEPVAVAPKRGHVLVQFVALGWRGGAGAR